MHERASKIRRLLNFLIDYLIILVITFILFAIHLTLTSEKSPLGNAEAVFYFIYITSFFTYYLFTELMWQRTIGKLITGTRVISLTSHKPNLKQIFIRSWIRTISLEVLSFIWARTGHHDLLSDTRVVRIRKDKNQ